MSFCNPCYWWKTRQERIKKQTLDLAIQKYEHVMENLRKDLDQESNAAKDVWFRILYAQKNNMGNEMSLALTYINHLRQMQILDKEMMNVSRSLQTVKRSNRVDTRREADAFAAKYVNLVTEDDEKDEENKDTLKEADEKHTEMMNEMTTYLSETNNSKAAQRLLAHINKINQKASGSVVSSSSTFTSPSLPLPKLLTTSTQPTSSPVPTLPSIVSTTASSLTVESLSTSSSGSTMERSGSERIEMMKVAPNRRMKSPMDIDFKGSKHASFKYKQAKDKITLIS